MVGLLFGQVGCGMYFPFLLVAAGVGVAFSVVGSFKDNGRALDNNSMYGQKFLFSEFVASFAEILVARNN